MTVRNLNHLFRPSSVAVIGASNRPRSVGHTVMRNLLEGGFAGPIMPVNPKYPAVAGVLAYPDLSCLPVTPDLAVICTPAQMVPGLIAELGAAGTKAAVVLTAGLSHKTDESGRTLRQAALEAAQPHLLRILGPNCVGLLVPGANLNASFAHTNAAKGRISVIHQSGALCTALLDWAASRGIGFSHFISLGNAADVDFGDLLDYLGSDPESHAILMYVESITHARKFMSAARAAARNKPVLAIKAGRYEEGARAAASHTGALAGADEVFDAAIGRAGMLRVFDTAEMFDAVETLARARPLRGDRLAILTNGGGPGVLATDALMSRGGRLAELSAGTLSRLDKLLPAFWSRGNPVDIIGDAEGERYAKALAILGEAKEVDAVLVMYAPTAIAAPEEVARAVIEAGRNLKRKPVLLTCWLGGDGMNAARRAFAGAGIPTYEAPNQAVRAFLHMADYRRNQEILMETPPAAPPGAPPVIETARLIVERAVSEGVEVLSEPDCKAILAAYGLPVVETGIATTPEEAARRAEAFDAPVAIKILSPDITHKSDVGGVVLDLERPQDVEAAAQAMLERVARLKPKAKVRGFTVQRMARRSGAHELILGATTDPVFGPVLLFGQGGVAVEVIGDRAVALPPLNMKLARELISRTRVSRLLEGYRDRPAADLEAIASALLRISQLVVDVPEVQELDVNPLLADAEGVLVLDARIRVAPAAAPGTRRLAIRPYPQELEEQVSLPSGRRLLLRPIRPEDEPEHRDLISRLTPEDIRFRFFGSVREMPHSQLARFTQIDYDREMAFVAKPSEKGERDTLGVVRAVADPNNETAEFAIVVRSDLKGQGLGHALLEKLVRYCRKRGTAEMVGEVLPDNKAMLALAERVGFSRRLVPDDDVVEVRLNLQDAARG